MFREGGFTLLTRLQRSQAEVVYVSDMGILSLFVLLPRDYKERLTSNQEIFLTAEKTYVCMGRLVDVPFSGRLACCISSLRASCWHRNAALTFQVISAENLSVLQGNFYHGLRTAPYMQYSQKKEIHHLHLDSFIIFIMAKLFKPIRYNEKISC